MASYSQKSILNQNFTNGTTPSRPSLASLTPSYSTSSIPTVKNNNGIDPVISPPKTISQQQFHNHNASLGRIPSNAVNNRMSREIASVATQREEPVNGYKQQQSELHASAAPFGPSMSTVTASESMTGAMSDQSISQFPGQPFYGGYGMQLLGMSPMQMGGPMGYNPLSLYQNQNHFPPYAPYGQPGRFNDSQTRIMQQRRMQNVEGR